MNEIKKQPVFDAIHRAVRAKHGVLNFVKDVRIDRLGCQAYLLPFGSFSLDVILPEEALLFRHARRS